MRFTESITRLAIHALYVLALFASATCAADLACAQTAQQSDQEVRDLINDRFVNPRPRQNSGARKPAGGRAQPAKAARPQSSSKPKLPPVYRPAPYSAAAPQPQPAMASGGRPAGAKGLVEKLIGLTVWRLRAPAPGDEARMLVHDEAGVLREEWTPVRAEAEATVTAGERVRITVESPEAGYLYVINRERYSDGTTSDPQLIFPTLRARGGDNRVEAGRLIEVPAQKDRPPYFSMRPSRADQVSEELLIVVTESRLDFSIGRSPLQLPAGQVRDWESRWLAQVVRLEQAGGDGKVWTEPERETGDDEKRKLTQDEPLPQTIYRVKTRAGNPLLIKVPLTYRIPGGHD
jgi:hypothetical protein